ncbi:TonB-dependent receptor [Novosphingobium umbonatum]|uniref:TonB-dependent receptor n=1 Tax=Novosphingobium umbonatum TaxID=1908524 RepID=A0A3S2UTF9_9SPHN|nr:TonB-dependent receptor [Novosphingobium umbonatum]RVU05877.1 TonB-dependent receptor [Novosphingobium umbonatum]
MKAYYRAWATATALASGLVWSTQAQAQVKAPQAEKEDQAIIVTGSRIRGVAPVGSNIIALDASKIAAEPVTSTNDLLRRVPQVVSLGANRNGGSAQNGSANATRGAGINLRGLSTNATLVLFDGRRLPPQGTQGQYTDPSVIPAIALERVEVVADGASAVYGSDAIAGVVNFILRRKFDGLELRARSGFTGGNFKEQQISGIFGRKWDSGNVMVAGDITHNSALIGGDLPWYQDNNTYRGGRDLRVTNCDTGTITAGGQTYAIPSTGVTSATASSLVAGTSNKCFYNRYDTVIPEQIRYNILGSFSQQISPAVRIFADGMYSWRDGKIGQFTNISATVRNTNPFFVAPAAGITSETVTWSLVPTNGGLDMNPYYGYSWNAVAGIEARPFGDFKATAYYSHGQSADVANRTVGVNTAALNAALADTNPATALNVFGGANNPATIAKIRDNLFIIIGRTRLDVLNVQTDGTLARLPGGALRVAAGAEYRREYTFTDLATGQAASPVHVTDAGSRNVKALFGELFLPIVGRDNAMPLLRQLSLSVAGRYEKYSDFGSTSNPKLGVTWKPAEMLSLRGSYGTSFRAPTFTEVSTVAGGAGLYYDTLPGASGNQTGIGIAGGNPNLKPETATTWSLGAEINPMRGLRASITYFDIDYKNQIIALRGTPGILTNPLYASFVTLNPSAAQVSALVGSGLPINSVINTNAVSFIVDGRRQNLGRAQVRGLDFMASYDWTIGKVKMDAGVSGTYYGSYKFQAVPGAAVASVANTLNFPQKFRMQGDVGAKVGIFATRFTWNHLSGYWNTGLTNYQHVSAYDTFDLSLTAEVTRNFRIGVDARNLFDRNPPFVDTTRGYDPQSASPLPRVVSVNAGVKF